MAGTLPYLLTDIDVCVQTNTKFLYERGLPYFPCLCLSKHKKNLFMEQKQPEPEHVDITREEQWSLKKFSITKYNT